MLHYTVNGELELGHLTFPVRGTCYEDSDNRGRFWVVKDVEIQVGFNWHTISHEAVAEDAKTALQQVLTNNAAF